MLPNPYLLRFLRFRRLVRAGLAVAAFVPLALAQAPPAAAARRACEIADIYRVLGVGNPAVAPGGARIAFAVRHTELEAGRSWSELWLCAGDGSGLRQMTTGHHGDTDPCFSPDGRTLLFVSNRSGTSQLWTMPVDGGEPRQLTDFGPGVAAPLWSPDGAHVAVTSEIFPECGIDAEQNARIANGLEQGRTKVHVADGLLYRHWNSWADGRRTHVLLVDGRTGRIVKDLTPGDFDSPIFELGGGRGFTFSPDGKELCFSSNRGPKPAESTNSDLWLVPVDGEVTAASARCITADNPGWDGDPLWSPDGRSIAFVSQATPGYESDLKRLAVWDRSTGKVRYLTARGGFDDWVNDMRWTVDSSALVFVADRRGRTPLFRIARDGGEPQLVLTHGTINGYELDGDEVVFAARTVAAPAEIFRAPLGGGGERRLTAFNETLAAEVDFRPAEEIEVAGEGGTKIQCFVVKPHGFVPGKRYPLVLNVHGGPQSQWTDGFRGDWQVYPGKGYVVAFANPTGSTGCGQDFTDAIAGDYGGRVFRDLMAVTDALQKLDYVDRDRMGAMGWSFGGYMMMWFQGHTDRFRCIAAMMGIFDLPSFYGSTEELWYPEHDLGGTPWTSELYAKWSPSNSVARFRTPSLVITGERDYRCPYTQSLAYHTALQKQNVPSRLIVFPEAGHWPAWHEMAFYYNAHLDFFHRWLGGEPAPYDVIEHARNLAFTKKAGVR